MRRPEWLRRVLARPVRSGLALAFIIEALTCFNRFVLGLRARDHVELLTMPTFGLRVHHGYLGLACLLIWGLGPLVRRPQRAPWRPALLLLGIGLALSDAVHHLLVLWPLTGSPEFP